MEKNILSEDEVCVTASIGVSVFPDHGDSMERLIKEADAAMYTAKNF